MRKLLALLMLAALTTPLAGARAALLPQNDAGSGTDAPDSPTPSFRIDPGVVYTGIFEGKTTGDRADWYAFTAPAGAAIEARASGVVACAVLHDGSGAELASACSIGYAELVTARAVAATAGTYYVRVYHAQPTIDDTVPQAYRFAVGVNAAAPSPTGAPTVADVAPPLAGGAAPVAPASQDDEHVVIAVVDSGVNPYHDFFAAPALTDHPSTWLPGFPASAESVNLSLGEPTYETATAADETTWTGLQRTTYNPAGDSFDTHLYTFPGTRVVGAVSFSEYSDATDPLAVPPYRPVLDEYGHGTHSAGLALGANLAAADGNVLLVLVEVGGGDFENGIRWAARQPWIDAISLSLGSRANAPDPASLLGEKSSADWATLEAHRSGKPVFVASGNGFSNSGLTPDHCTTYTSPYTGPSWITRIGAAKPVNGNPTLWHCVPVEAVAKTDVYSPDFTDQTDVTIAGGTSAATPNAAGHFAHLLLAARRAGSAATRDQVVSYLLHAAAPAPLGAGANDPSVYPVSLADQGYGLVDQAALDAATSRLLGASGPAPRPETEAWFGNDRAIRDALWGPGAVMDGPDLGLSQDDAGSGGDAPDGKSTAITVQPGVRYDGMLTGIETDEDDWYSFAGTAGDVVTLQASGAVACYDLVSPSGVVAGSSCTAGYAYDSPVVVTLPESGTWFISVGYFVPQTYSFGFGVNGPPPAVFP